MEKKIRNSGILGCQIILNGFPQGYNFGLDMYMWTVGDKFKGVSQISSGVHFVYFSSPSDEFRQGFFLDLHPDEILVRKWDVDSETLVPYSDAREETRVMSMACLDFEFMSGIAPFSRCMDSGLVSEWHLASNFISSNLVSSLPGGVPDWGGVATFLVPSGVSDLGEISKLHMDKTCHLVQLLAGYSQDPINEILGEVQCSFLHFLLGVDFDSYQNWRELVQIFLNSVDGIEQYSFLFSEFLSILGFQLKHAIATLEDDSLILVPLSRFLQLCIESGNGELTENAQKLSALMTQISPNWPPVDPDDQPCIV